jgi:hypothetical protein
MRAFGFPCKTPGCEVWLKLGDMPEDEPRAIRFPINLGDDWQKLTCPECKQAHDYKFADREIRHVTP